MVMFTGRTLVHYVTEEEVTRAAFTKKHVCPCIHSCAAVLITLFWLHNEKPMLL